MSLVILKFQQKIPKPLRNFISKPLANEAQIDEGYTYTQASSLSIGFQKVDGASRQAKQVIVYVDSSNLEIYNCAE